MRIIRINEDGSIRIIFSGEKSVVDQVGKERVLANGYNDSSTNYMQIQTSKYNSSFGRSENVGFRYFQGQQRPNDTNSGIVSTIKGVLDSWYNINLQTYDSMIINTSGFCNDREVANGFSWSSQPSGTIYYRAYERVKDNKIPSFDCSNINDLYTTKIGLITADEVAYAGGIWNTVNQSYYLYTDSVYWTMTPYWFNATDNWPCVFYVWGGGRLHGSVVNLEWGIRPVINLKADVKISGGNGTSNNPYVI